MNQGKELILCNLKFLPVIEKGQKTKPLAQKERPDTAADVKDVKAASSVLVSFSIY